MSHSLFTRSMRRRAAVLTAVLATIPMAAHAAPDDPGRSGPRLAARAVLPAATYAAGPPSGAFLLPPPQTERNGITFPTSSQPVLGVSGIISGPRPGEYLAMADNGFGSKANSPDFLIRAYVMRPDFTTTKGGTGTVEVGDFVQFSDPNGLIGFPIVREATEERWLTGADVDPESIQRDRRGDLWIGDEFGPWILHFDATGRLLERPVALPGLQSPNNPHLVPPATVPNSRGIEAMAITPNGRNLVVVMEGAVVGDDPAVRRIYRYDLDDGSFERLADYRVEVTSHMVSDVQSIDGHRLVVVERDGGSGLNALFRRVYVVDPGPVGSTATKQQVVDLAAIPDPDLVSLPAIHDGDVGLGDPFRVTCESIEAVSVLSHDRLLFGCDNNLPNTGRNPALADDTELIIVSVPGLRPMTSTS